MVEYMFGEFETPYLYMYTGSVLFLFASGRTTGFVVDSGEGRTHAVPIYEGFALSHGALRLDISGKIIMKCLKMCSGTHNPHLPVGIIKVKSSKSKNSFAWSLLIMTLLKNC